MGPEGGGQRLVQCSVQAGQARMQGVGRVLDSGDLWASPVPPHNLHPRANQQPLFKSTYAKSTVGANWNGAIDLETCDGSGPLLNLGRMQTRGGGH